MFGNKKLKEVQNQLEIAISIAANQIFCLDPATRSLILKVIEVLLKIEQFTQPLIPHLQKMKIRLQIFWKRS